MLSHCLFLRSILSRPQQGLPAEAIGGRNVQGSAGHEGKLMPGRTPTDQKTRGYTRNVSALLSSWPSASSHKRDSDWVTEEKHLASSRRVRMGDWP